MMSDHNEVLSFFEVLQKYKIEIPIIQRDYAQGRIENERVRKSFLDALKNSIAEENSINLDFVYGNIVDGAFQPLDGQQRLTTLYLLHWYAFSKECPNDLNAKSALLKFTYETRISSREFCRELISNPIIIDDSEEKISGTITDSEWFFMSWNQDPTIRSMLNTIDDINILFHDIKDLWCSLTEKRLITFHLLILEHFGLSDDLYIKMNARGKLLTPFENFKAELQKKSQENNWETQAEQTDLFAHKIDTRWTDFLWSKFRYENSIDDAHMRFITTLIMIKLSSGQPALKATERAECLQKLNESSVEKNLVSLVTKETFDFIYKCYEAYSTLFESGMDLDLGLNLPMWRHQPARHILSEILIGSAVAPNNTSSYTHKVLFYAQTEYLLRTPNPDKSTFGDWMRVIRNIVSRADITSEGKRPDIVRSPDTFYGAINLIQEIAAGCNNIYEFLLKSDIKSSFAKEQMREEKIKAQIIQTYPEHKSLIFKTEDNELLRGKIMFVLQCAKYSTDINEIDFTILSAIQRVFETYFNNESQPLHLLRRAMLTIGIDGVYEFYNYWWSYWYAGKADKRKLFVQFREIEYFIGCEHKEYFKKLVLTLAEKNYSSIIEDFEKPDNMPNWQYRLIKEEGLLVNECKSNYIAIPPDKSCCYLLKSKRPSDLDGSPKIV